MRRLTSTLTAIAAAVAILFVPAELSAQEAEDTGPVFDIQVETGLLFGQNFINGVGSEMETFSSQSIDNVNRVITQDYGYTETPITFDRGMDQSFALDLSYSPTPEAEGFFSGTSFNLRLERVSTSSSLEGRVESEPGALVGEGTLRWVKMWDANVIPVINTQNPSGLTAIDYHANDQFENWVVGASVDQNIFSLDGYSLAIIGGVKFANPSYTLVVGQRQRAFTPYIGSWVLDNEITLETESKSNAFMLGPTVGLSFNKDFDPFNIGFNLKHTVFHSWNDQVGVFTDIDNIRFKNTDSPEDNFTQRLDGRATFERERTDWVSNTDIRLTAGFDAGPVELGGGATISVWRNMPLAPTFHNPWGLGGSSKAPTGVDWQVERRSLSLSGFVLYAETSIH